MENCIQSLLPGGEDIEIIIVDDGSTKDRTAEIADEYAAKYPTIIKAVHQENGGHGQAVNTGMKHATGLYYKVIDSDDWADRTSLLMVIERMKQLEEDGTPVDMFLANFIYDKVGARHKKVMHFRKAFPTDQIFGWDKMRHLKQSQYILMHNLFFRLDVLKRCKLQLPKHTFYVDNIFAFQPYPYVEKMYYMDVDFYHYFIGREDQSVNEQVMIGRLDQQMRVNKLMIDIMADTDFTGKDRHLKKYMYIYLDKIMAVTCALCLVSGTPENLKRRKEIWRYLHKKDRQMYLHLRTTPIAVYLNMPGFFGRKVAVRGYKIVRKFMGFN